MRAILSRTWRRVASMRSKLEEEEEEEEEEEAVGKFKRFALCTDESSSEALDAVPARAGRALHLWVCFFDDIADVAWDTIDPAATIL